MCCAGRDLSDIYILSDIVELVPSVYPFEFGSTFIRPIIMLPPRSLNPGKPAHSTLGAKITDLFYNQRGFGIPPTAVGELYWNFGWIGIIVGMTVFGWLCQRMYRMLIHGGNNPSIILLYSVLFTYGVHNFVAGDSSLVVGSLLINLILVTGLFLLAVRNQDIPPSAELGSVQR